MTDSGYTSMEVHRRHLGAHAAEQGVRPAPGSPVHAHTQAPTRAVTQSPTRAPDTGDRAVALGDRAFAPADRGSAAGGRAALAAVDASTAGDQARQICHDVSTPAVTIRLLAEQILGQQLLEPAAARHLQQVVRETERIAEICGSVLGEPRPHRVVRVDQVAAEVVRSARLAQPATIEHDLRPTVVLAHSVGVRRLVANLVDNACRVAGPSGRVRVVVSPTGTGAQVRVLDSGPGPGPWTAPLRGAPPGPRAAGQRAGIGLSIVARVVEECGGRVAVHRGSLGGSAVIVDFPPVAGVVPATG